jgi:hypothetical protein
MTAGRKTISVDRVRLLVNEALAAHVKRRPDDRSARQALASILESILLETGNYRGYGYHASPDDVRAGDFDPTDRRYH